MPKNDQTAATATSEPEGWRPQAGDVLTGTVSEVGKGWSDYTNSFYPIVTIQDTNGKQTSVHCFQEVLKQRMLDLRPVVGTEIEITCMGKRPTRDGKREVVVYKVSVPGETGEQVWNDLGAQPHKAATAGRPIPEADVPADTDGLNQQEEIPF